MSLCVWHFTKNEQLFNTQVGCVFSGKEFPGKRQENVGESMFPIESSLLRLEKKSLGFLFPGILCESEYKE